MSQSRCIHCDDESSGLVPDRSGHHLHCPACRRYRGFNPLDVDYSALNVSTRMRPSTKKQALANAARHQVSGAVQAGRPGVPKEAHSANQKALAHQYAAAQKVPPDGFEAIPGFSEYWVNRDGVVLRQPFIDKLGRYREQRRVTVNESTGSVWLVADDGKPRVRKLAGLIHDTFP